MGLFEFQSLGSDTVCRWKDTKAHVQQYQMPRAYYEFRRANKKEILGDKKAKAMYYLIKILVGVGALDRF